MKDVLISLTTSMPNDPFTPEPLIIECVLFNINYSLKSLINTEAVNYSFINELIAQHVYD